MELQRELVISRLKQSLADGGSPGSSTSELREDWQLLKKIDEAGRKLLSEKFNQENH